MKPTKLVLLTGLLCAALSAGYLASQPQDNKAEVALQAAIKTETVDGNLKGAIEQYKKIAAQPGAGRATVATALLRMGQCYEKLGDANTREARKAYEQVVREFGDQAESAAEARVRLAALAGAARTASGSTMAVRRVWAGPDVDLEGGVSPDGRYVCFIDWSTGDLAVRDLVKGESRRLTKNPAGSGEYADFAAFSPDGKQVAYAWCDKDGHYDLRVVGMDGSEPRVIHRSQDVSYFSPLAWSHDGKYILSLVSQKKEFEIALVSATNGAVRVLKSVGRRFPHSSISPDGRWIAFDFAQDESPGQHDIYLIATDGAHEVRLIEHPANDLWPVWTPDGTQLLFVSDRGGTLGFWLVSVLDGQAQGPPQLVKADVGRIRPFDIIDNGSLYYGLTAGTGEVYEAELDPKSGKLISPPSPAMKHFVGFNGTPDYSPDGESLACISLRGSITDLTPGNRSLVIRSLKSGDEREIPLSIAPGWELKWSPDSRSVLVPGVDIRGRFNLYVIDVSTGALKPLGMSAGMNNFQGSLKGWFPDQKSLYLVVGAPRDGQGRAQARLVRYSLAGKEMQDTFLYRPDDGALRSVMLSPDGKQFAFWRHNSKTGSSVLLVIPATGGEPRELFSMKGDVLLAPGGTPAGLSWTPDGRYLFFAARTAPDSKEMALWRIAVAGGAPEKAGPLPEKVYDVVVHPSGNRVVFSTVGMKQEVWVMENFLPPLKVAK